MTLRPAGRTSYANVVSTLALVIAVGGTGAAVAAAALPHNSVGSPQIKNNSVKSKDLKDNNIKGVDVKDNTLTQKDLAAGPVGVVRAYAWVNNASATQVLGHSYVYNSAGGPVTSNHQGVGQYQVVFANLNIAAGNVQVTGYGSNANECKVASWFPSGANVRCFDPAGAPADTLFSIAMIE